MTAVLVIPETSSGQALNLPAFRHPEFISGSDCGKPPSLSIDKTLSKDYYISNTDWYIITLQKQNDYRQNYCYSKRPDYYT